MPRFSLTRDDAIATITFDDGGMNLLGTGALLELRDLLRGHEVTGSLGHGVEVPSRSAAPISPLRALLFRSGRARLFAAGADMAEMRAFDGWRAYEFSALGQELFSTIEKLPLPTVCFIDGDCFGGALDLALSFDLRLATARSRFSHPGARIGIVTGFGGTSRWRKVIDSHAARKLFLSNDTFDAASALSTGLVDAIVDDPRAHLARITALDDVTTRFVKELSGLSPRLSRSELLLLGRRLGHIYFPPQRQAE